MPEVTKHAAKRIKQRLGLPMRGAEKTARLAMEKGLRHGDTTGYLRRYMDALYLRHRVADNVRIWNGNAYLFAGDVLITVFPLPPRMRKEAEKQIKRRGQ